MLHDEPAISGPPAAVGEAEESEGVGSPLAAPLTREGREPTKLDQPRLVLMEHQAKAGQPRLEGQEHLLRIRLALEAHEEVVRIAHGHNATACAATTPLVGPEVEDVVQKDVGQERTDARPLRGPPVRFLLLAASRKMRGSAILCATIRSSHSWSTESKKLSMSVSFGLQYFGAYLPGV
jgi:hypothetical protein